MNTPTPAAPQHSGRINMIDYSGEDQTSKVFSVRTEGNTVASEAVWLTEWPKN